MAPDGMGFTLEIKCCCSDLRVQLVALQNKVERVSQPARNPIPSESAEEDINLLEEVEDDNH